MQQEGALIFPPHSPPKNGEADYRIISKLLTLLNIKEEDLLTDLLSIMIWRSVQKYGRPSLHGNRFGASAGATA